MESEQAEEGSDYPYKYLAQNQLRNRDAARILDFLKRPNIEQSTNTTIYRSLKMYDYEGRGNDEKAVVKRDAKNYMKDSVITKRLHKPNNSKELLIDYSKSYVNRELYSNNGLSLPVSLSLTNPIVSTSNSKRDFNLNLETVKSKQKFSAFNKGDNLFVNSYNRRRTRFRGRNVSSVNYFDPEKYPRNNVEINSDKLFLKTMKKVGGVFRRVKNSSRSVFGVNENLNKSERKNKLQRYLNDDIINLVHVNNSDKFNKYGNVDQETEYEDNDVQSTMWKHRSRKLDTYAESLLYVNKIYNLAYGFERRRVPAHMPLLLDKSIVEEMQKKFDKEFKKTSSHRVRDQEDMQFAFSYFYFLTSEKINISVGSIFDIFDMDKSG